MKTLSKALITCFLLGNLAYGEMFYPLSKLSPKKEKTSNEKKDKFKPEKTKIPVPKFTLNAVISSRKGNYALINGRLVGEGEKVDSCKILKIEPVSSTVILNCQGIRVKLTVDLLNGEKR